MTLINETVEVMSGITFCASPTMGGVCSFYKDFDDFKNDRPFFSWTVEDDDTQEDIHRKVEAAWRDAIGKREG